MSKEDNTISGYWFWDKWYDHIFRWKTVVFKNGQATMKFKRKTWSYESGWLTFEERKNGRK